MYQGQFVIDGHADILYRMGHENLDFYDDGSTLHQSYKNLRASGVDLQVFVTFVEPKNVPAQQLYHVLASLHRFHMQVERVGFVTPVYTSRDLEALVQGERRAIGALLSLEGADALNGEISVLEALFQMGIRLVGLTWNGANSLADGVGELRGAGLTHFGRTVVTRMNELGMVVDVSHLAARGVSDVLEICTKPIIASHSNAAAVYAHRRNLTDEQIVAIARSGGVIGLTFVPSFVGDAASLTTDDLMRHLDHLLEVAGPQGVSLGSDFDGIEQTLQDLRCGQDYPTFLEKIERKYGLDVLRKVAGENLIRVLKNVLPR